MDIVIRRGAEICVVVLRGRFDAHEVDAFVAAVDELKGEGVLDFGVDLSEVDFIDSSALASLVSLATAAKADGRHFDLRSPSDPVRVILELTGLDRALEIHEPGSPATARR